MRTARLGGLEVGRIGLGTMGMSWAYGDTGSEEDSIATIHRAIDLGVTLIDTAEIYGPYTNERLVGKALAGRRDDVVLATKFGAVSHPAGADDEDESPGPDSSPSSMRTALEGSLRRLGTDHIDLFYQHRVDPTIPIEDVVGTLAGFVTEGKVRYLGLSEASADTIRRAHAEHPIAAVQTEYSLWTRDPERAVLPAVRELGIGFVPYSPLGRGFLTGAITSPDDLADDDFRASNPRFAEENFATNMRIVDVVRGVADEAGATPAQVALAWLLAQGDGIVPIPGTKRAARVEENAGADALVLDDEQLERLSALPNGSGDRYPDMTAVERDTPVRV